MFNMDEMMNQVKAFQENLRSGLEKMAITKTSGGDAVTVVVNGSKEVTKIEFGPGGPADREILADHVLAALNAAYEAVDRETKKHLPDLNALGIPGLTDLFKK